MICLTETITGTQEQNEVFNIEVDRSSMTSWKLCIHHLNYMHQSSSTVTDLINGAIALLKLL